MADVREVRVPDIGDFDQVDVVEVLVEAGDTVEEDQSLITLESDKASMEVPSPAAGTVKEVKVSVGDQIGQDALILVLETAEGAGSEDESKEKAGDEAGEEAGEEAPEDEAADEEPEAEEPEAEEPETEESQEPQKRESGTAGGERETGGEDLEPIDEEVDEEAFEAAYASPSVRKLARELGVDLGRVEGSGRSGRITPDDVKSYVREALKGEPGPQGKKGVEGFDWPQMPDVDFAKFGEVETKPLSRIRKVAKRNLHRSWLHVPHVTQHEEADVTELEAFRKEQGEKAKEQGFKLTPLAFLLKAAAASLKEFPDFNSSLDATGENLVLKKYVHIGVAVDTDDGLVVPVIRDVDQKGLYQLAEEVVEAARKARAGKLMPKDFQGACFTISSLGGIGGTAFTPIVNAPEVAILGVSRNRWKPVWKDTANDQAGDGEGAFERRLMMPLSLSYDHRVVDGASACRFTVHLAGLLEDLRKLLL